MADAYNRSSIRKVSLKKRGAKPRDTNWARWQKLLSFEILTGILITLSTQAWLKISPPFTDFVACKHFLLVGIFSRSFLLYFGKGIRNALSSPFLQCMCICMVHSQGTHRPHIWFPIIFTFLFCVQVLLQNVSNFFNTHYHRNYIVLLWIWGRQERISRSWTAGALKPVPLLLRNLLLSNTRLMRSEHWQYEEE